MASNKKTRKKYIKREANPMSIYSVLYGLSPVRNAIDILNAHKIQQIAALNKIKAGTATVQDFDVLIDLINLCEAFWQQGLGRDYYPLVKAARESIQNLGSRYREIGRFVAKSEELNNILSMMELYDAQLQCLTVDEMIDTIRQVEKFYCSKTKSGLTI